MVVNHQNQVWTTKTWRPARISKYVGLDSDGQYESFSGRGPQDIQLRLELYIYIYLINRDSFMDTHGYLQLDGGHQTELTERAHPGEMNDHDRSTVLGMTGAD